MLRTLTIAALFLVNLSVWMGPAETFLGFTAARFDPAPRLERAEQYVVAGDFESALREYRMLAAREPENPTYRYAYGLFCYVQSEYLIQQLGWERVEIVRIALAQLQRASELDADDYDLALDYAMVIMDADFSAGVVGRDEAIHAWERILDLIEARHAREPNVYQYSTSRAQVLTHLARVEARFDRPEGARAYLARARAAAPAFRLPERLVSFASARRVE